MIESIPEILCSRCGKSAEQGSWEKFHNCAKISITRASQIFKTLVCSDAICADNVDFECWADLREHPLILKMQAQMCEMSYGYHDNYSLCSDCHDEFIKTVGKFFHFDDIKTLKKEQLKTSLVSDIQDVFQRHGTTVNLKRIEKIIFNSRLGEDAI